MNSHRQPGDVSDLNKGWLARHFGDTFRWAAVLAFFLVCWMGAMRADDEQEQIDMALAARAQVLAREREVLTSPAQVTAAYERGLSDAFDALRGTPDGLALAQACMALGVRR